jgi:hypothetical protein
MTSFDPALLMLSLIPSGIGFVLFMYGKKMERFPQLVAGLALLVYPYFTDSVLAMTGVGIAIGAALYWALWLGW